MKHIKIIIILLAALIFQGSCKKEQTSSAEYDKALLGAVNDYRISKGLSALQSNDTLWQIANVHSKNMANGTVPFGHEGLTQRSDLVMAELGSGTYTENVAWGQGKATDVVNTWLESAGHKTNIQGNFNLTGLSAVQSKDGNYYYTQIFFKKGLK